MGFACCTHQSPPRGGRSGPAFHTEARRPFDTRARYWLPESGAFLFTNRGALLFTDHTAFYMVEENTLLIKIIDPDINTLLDSNRKQLPHF